MATEHEWEREIRQAGEHYKRRIRQIDREETIMKWVAILICPVAVVATLVARRIW